MPKCSYRGCGHEAESLGQLRKHYTEAGHKVKRKKRPEAPPPEETEIDLELTLLTKAVELFGSAGTDADADERVIRYLITRYAPSILQSLSVDDEDAA